MGGRSPSAPAVSASATYAEGLGVVLVAQLLCTVLPPLIRRLGDDERPVIAVPSERAQLAAELRAIANRITAAAGDDGLRSESDRLRRLARTLD